MSTGDSRKDTKVFVSSVHVVRDNCDLSRDFFIDDDGFTILVGAWADS
jgi:hypothetical protein